MTQIQHRDLRNNSAEILRRVAAGESMVITNRGLPVARLSPLTDSTLDDLIASGGARPSRSTGGFSDLKRQTGLSTKAVLDDLRGDE